MGLFDFVKQAGEKLFGAKEAEEASAAVDGAPDDAEALARLNELNRTAAEAIEAYIRTQDLQNLGVAYGLKTNTGEVWLQYADDNYKLGGR